jgi:hypothetical protein
VCQAARFAGYARQHAAPQAMHEIAQHAGVTSLSAALYSTQRVWPQSVGTFNSTGGWR